jgi:EmrB/QacA subfamily drug resistance transporter
MSDTAAKPAWAPPKPSPHAWRALIVLLIAMFMSLLDTTIVNVALQTIRTNVNGAGHPAASADVLLWIISGYALAFGVALIPAGRLGDRLGHKWVFFSGLALFTAASLACGLAQSDVQLIVFRVVQGLGAGVFVPAVTAYIQILFQGRVRGTAFAIMGAVIGVSSALGPIIGGLIIQGFGTTNGWRLIFGVNLPIGVVALVLAIGLIPGNAKLAQITKSAQAVARTGVDWIGLLLLAGGLVAILVPLIEGQQKGWPLWTYLCLVGGVVLIVLFAVYEVSYVKRGKSALVPPHLFSHPAFTGGVILALVYFAAFTSIFFTISLLWQEGLGHTALESGLVSVPFAIGSIIGSSQSNRLAQRLGRTVLVIGTVLVVLGLATVWFILTTVKPSDLTSWQLLAPLFFAGLGNGMFIAPNAQFIVATVDTSEAGAASGVISTMQRVGSAIGIAVIGSVLFGVANLSGLTAEIHKKVGAALQAGTYTSPASASTAISKASLATHFTDAAGAAMGVSVLLALVALVLVFALPRRLSQQWGSKPE